MGMLDSLPSTLEFARAYAAAGLAVVPVETDGSKRPRGKWDQWQERIASEGEIGQLFRGLVGVGIVCGAVSGNLETLDVDSPELVEPFEALVREAMPGLLERLCIVATPRNNYGGRHYRYRLAGPVAGNTKLALSELRPQFNADGSPLIDQRTGKQRLAPETLIETRGEGGYAIVPGSPPECHQTGLPYKHIAGPELTAIETISAEEHGVLWRAARSLNRYVDDREVRGERGMPNHNGNGHSGKSPGDDFNERATWEQILEPVGWSRSYSSGGLTYWCRPGKTRGISATTGVQSSGGTELLCVFSSNAFPLEGAANGRPCTSYSKFAAWATLNRNGDFSAAAKALAADGYGDRQPVNRLAHYEEREAPASAFEDQPPPDAVLTQVHGHQAQPVRPIVYQRITAAELASASYHTEFLIDGAMTLLEPLIVAGGKKTLKTGLLCDAAVSLAMGNDLLGTMKVARAVRVLFMSGESGLATLQETFRRICRAKGCELGDVQNLILSPDLPRLDDANHHVALAEMLRGDEIEVLIVDPAYMAMGGDDAGNLFKQGTVLRSFNSLCHENGVTLILCHHTRKNVVDQFKPPELEDIAWAGFQEFARQ